MAQNTTATPDQIPKEAAGRVIGQLGDCIRPGQDGPRVRWVPVAISERHENVQRALFIDGEQPESLVYAWTNDNRTTWKVEDEGTEINVGDVDLEVAKEDEPVDDATSYAQEWVEILISELRKDVKKQKTQPSVSDERRLVGSQVLRLRDFDGREMTANFSLEG